MPASRRWRAKTSAQGWPARSAVEIVIQPRFNLSGDDPFQGSHHEPQTYLSHDTLILQSDGARESTTVKLNRSSIPCDRGAKSIAKVRGKLLQRGFLSGLIQLMAARQTNDGHSIIRLGPGSNPAILHSPR